MSLKFVVAAAALSLFTGQAFAEGNGDPFPFQAGHQATVGRPFVADTGSADYPALTGNTTQSSTLARIEPVAGSEGVVQTAGSLPRGFGDGSVADARAQSLGRYWAGRSKRARHFEIGTAAPRS